ncbi:Rha family transcriptional regulator [Telluria beijingensis]|uniref:Rha family transcriptional regulator n=1 Tax=Telluria beijingensis TaxID=3068633 RepID=UPI00279627AB|nr:Rha family transcriptional regulator [Massilia sp. REN29]
MNNLVTIDRDRIVTDSQTLARTFGKRHANVLKAYDNLQCSKEFSRLNFELAEYLDAQGKLRRRITMTKDGFAMLAMGFTGPKAVAFKEDYIRAFNEMADALQRGEQSLWQQMQALIAKEAESQVRASFGSHLMLERKRALPNLRDEREELTAQIQPSLLS